MGHGQQQQWDNLETVRQPKGQALFKFKDLTMLYLSALDLIPPCLSKMMEAFGPWGITLTETLETGQLYLPRCRFLLEA